MSKRLNIFMEAMRIFSLCIIVLILLLPLIIIFFTSFKPIGEVITVEPTFFPQVFTMQNYINLFTIRAFPKYMLNSFFVASFTAMISLTAASFAAFAIVWIQFSGKKIIVKMLLVTYMVPKILLLIPLFIMCYRLNLIDTRMGLVLTYLSYTLPLSVWLLKTYFESIPVELVESALIDGCDYFKCLVKIVLPVALPGIATVFIFTFVSGWTEYLFANILINSDGNRTIAAGLQTLLGYYRSDYALLAAASTVMTLPVFILFIFIQKQFIKGLTIGAVKG